MAITGQREAFHMRTPGDDFREEKRIDPSRGSGALQQDHYLSVLRSTANPLSFARNPHNQSGAHCSQKMPPESSL
jgi:hypothetical protein